MKKRVLVCLIVILMMFCFSASGEYKKYELKVGDASSALTWSFYPIDAHNVIVIARSLYGKELDVPYVQIHRMDRLL